MSKLLEKSLDELCANTVDTVDRIMGRYNVGLTSFTSLITVSVIFFGTLFISYGSINVADLIAFLLYVTNLIDPVKKLLNFTEQFQEGVTGFERFMEILEIEPDIQDTKNAVVFMEKI